VLSCSETKTEENKILDSCRRDAVAKDQKQTRNWKWLTLKVRWI